MSERKDQRRQRFHGRVQHESGRACEAPGCDAPGEFKAPRTDKAGGAAEGWRWFCLDHVRAFNAGYNYFDGMSPEEIARAQSPHQSWERQTRGFATNANADPERMHFADPLGVLRDRYGAGVFSRTTTRDGRLITAADRKALDALELDEKATLGDIRRRYTDLVRRYHPDANGGDRTHERKLQDVIDAYTHLKACAAFAATA